ncbi:protein phosphatase regulator [Colletotrichum higginsianum]|nr:protein phosphatase regulator [Colletotrichum higginsianum]
MASVASKALPAALPCPAATAALALPLLLGPSLSRHNKLNFEQPIHDTWRVGPHGGLRLKVNKSTGNLASDNLSSRLTAPSGQAFANRYDFGASLTAAVQAAKDTSVKDRNPDDLYMKSHRKIQVPAQQPQQPYHSQRPSLPGRHCPGPNVGAPAVSKPVLQPVAPGTDSPNTSLASSSYEELVNKYCFPSMVHHTSTDLHSIMPSTSASNPTPAPGPYGTSPASSPLNHSRNTSTPATRANQASTPATMSLPPRASMVASLRRYVAE